MAKYDQFYGHVDEVVNVTKANSATESAPQFKQIYDEVGKVKNISAEKEEQISELACYLENMNEEIVNEYIQQLYKRSYEDDEKREYEKLCKSIAGKKNKPKAILDYIKSATVGVSFVTALIKLAEVIITHM